MYQEKTDLSDHVQVLKGACPMPDLMERIGLGDHAKTSCTSPFREDRNPSFGVFQSGSNWFFKDHATGESGDEIKLLALQILYRCFNLEVPFSETMGIAACLNLLANIYCLFFLYIPN